ncbi:MAG: exo-alpha-sialidase, partial [Candidatus Nitrosocosmicus sp.]|nr:exo-alpha-sialidase [Candidatus Nitrosocosmicus sp.]
MDSTLFKSTLTIFLFLLIIPLSNIIPYSNNDKSNLVFSKVLNPVDNSKLYNLSNNKNDSVYGQIQSVDKTNFSLVWQDSNFKTLASNHLDRNYDIFFKSVNLNNISSDETLNLSNNSGFSEHPHIASSGNNVYLAWVDNSNGYEQVFLRSSADGGKTFGESLSLSNDNVNASNVDIYSNDNHVFIVWQQSNSTHSSVALLSSDDQGKSFGSETLPSEYSSNSYPKVFADEYNVYISWNVDVDNRFDPSVIQEQEGVMGFKPGIYFVKSEDLEKSFSSPVRFAYNNSFDSGKSQVSVFDKYVYITWVQRDAVNELGNLFTAKSSDGGNNFTTDQIPLFANQILDAANLDTIAYQDKLFTSFEGSIVEPETDMTESSESTFNKEIFLFMRSFNQTGDYSIYNLSWNSGISECPSITI